MQRRPAKGDYSFVFRTCRDFSRQFAILDKIGEGDSANVFRVLERASGAHWALKAFNHKNFRGRPSPGKASFLKEQRVNARVRQALPAGLRRRIVKIARGFREKKELFLLCELMKGDLSHKALKVGEAQAILQHVGGVLEHMHRSGFVHLDVSPGSLTREHSLRREDQTRLRETGLLPPRARQTQTPARPAQSPRAR